MGALHAGHGSLISRAARENDSTVISIFVNPTQFAPTEDYRTYPRDEAADAELARTAGARALFIPSVETMYPAGATADLTPSEIAVPLEGARRPGHFAGVVTVVARLFSITKPDRAYFAQKDFQQLRVVQELVKDLHLSLQIVPCETVRDADGLALSSRNRYLSAADRARAGALPKALAAAREAWIEGENEAASLRALVTDLAQPAGDLDYVSVADPVTLDELQGPIDRAVISLACRVGKARLIDNILVGMQLSDLS